MGRYDNDENYTGNGTPRQRDLVLSTNEFCFIQSKTNGQIKTYTGPIMVTISQQESMVVFNNKTKRFEETGDFEKARQIFTSAPEGWYVVLKNPAKDNTHPDEAKAVNSPELLIGKKINISGPCSFSLYPGQMAKVVQGHRLRSNQYLLARVYDAEAAERSSATIIDADGKEVKSEKEKYFVGQLLVIKGTEVSFYMPPTGIEVLATNKKDGIYVRDAITLERLEYAILKDEDGEKRYIHGPAVVFPKPTETFVESPKGGNIFRALELSPISGIYVKVIADYKEGDKVHKTGEELFITGNEQMIYYPRPEHALIQYDGRYMHHAIAIPEGEGRYILDRLNGDIKTIIGPKMYLPDPRKEVVVKRKLTEKECKLFYPGNEEALKYNQNLTEKAVEKVARQGNTNSVADLLNSAYSTSNQLDSLAIFEANANISRGVSYTKPRTITLDTKFDGVVSIDVWNGYAICVVSKTGKREIVVGPKTRILNYDETLETVVNEKDGTTVFLPLNNNKIIDKINAQTSDLVDVQIALNYNVDFIESERDAWFNVYNYEDHVKDYARNLIKRTIKNYTVQDFYQNATDIIRKAILNDNDVTVFDNGSVISDVEVMSVALQRNIAEMVNKHQEEILSKNLELSDAEARLKVITSLAENEKKEAALKNANKIYEFELYKKIESDKLAWEEQKKQAERDAMAAATKAKADMQELLNQIKNAELAREKAAITEDINRQKELAEIEQTKNASYAKTVKEIMESVQPGLIEALSAQTNASLVSGIGEAISPYAMANGESVADVVSTLLRGSSLEKSLGAFINVPKVDAEG